MNKTNKIINEAITEAFNAGWNNGKRYERQRTIDMLDDNIKNSGSSNLIIVLRRLKEIILERYTKDED